MLLRPFRKPLIYEFGYRIGMPDRIPMVLKLFDIGNPGFMNPAVVGHGPENVAFPNQPRLQASLYHLVQLGIILRMKIGIAITKRCISSISLERLKTIQMRVLLMFGATFIGYVLPQPGNMILRGIFK